MDSLLCKIGSLRPLVPPSPPRSCEGPCDASKAPPRSVQICACRSPPPPPPSQSKTSPAEEGTSKQGYGSFLPSFNPLPLLSSHSVIPAPLKFLWLNRTNQQAADGDQDPLAPGCAGNEEGILFNDIETSIEREAEYAHFELEVNDVLGLMEKPELSDRSKVGLHGQKETLDDSITHAHDEEIAKVNHNNFEVDDVGDDMSHRTASSGNPDSTSSPLRHERSWISRIADIKAFWPDPKAFLKQSTSTQPPTPLSSLHPSLGTSQPSEADGNDVACNLDGALGCSLEVPYTKVLHTKESYSRFLQDASLYDMKVYAQLVFLCDTAYMIPDIQPSQLMKYHHLRLVTSSLDKKAEAESKAKEGESSKEPGTIGRGSVDNGSIKSNVESSQSNLHCRTEPSDMQPLKAAHTNAVQTDVPCLTEESKASSLSQINCEQGQSISSPVLELLEGSKTVDEDSVMTVGPVAATILAEEETKSVVAKDLQSSRSCPCEWFVCDEPSTYTRMFVIQGSESLASWQANLFFEPTKFEELDVFVHCGIYEAAKALYDEVLPEVLAHISTHGDLARTRFTGHSLGGSLATLLALMFQIRGVLPSTAILPVVTFGSPCIMCGGDYLLQKLKLPKNHIQSVMMHRDVVPRAFACDYPDHVAEVLKRLNGRFRDHPCLNNQKLLYAPMGQFVILQPDENAAPFHPLLPAGHGLYVLRHPMNGDDVKNAIELRAAQRAFLNMPHPLDILSDPGAYGFDGALSRDHDPRSYTKAIHVVLKQEVKRLRRVQREQRRQLWWPLVLAESSSLLQKGSSAGVRSDHSKTAGALAPTISRTSHFFKQPVIFTISNHIGFSMRGRWIWESHKGAFNRYARLIAAQHVHMGMLLVLSLQMVILECLSTLLVWV